VITFIVLITAFACTHSQPRTQPDRTGNRTAYLEVQNSIPEPFDMYASDGSQRLRMGRVNPLSTTRLRIPPSLVFPATTLEFIAVPISGTNPAISEQLAVNPGEVIRLQLSR
jgi:hypothetical protein